MGSKIKEEDRLESLGSNEEVEEAQNNIKEEVLIKCEVPSDNETPTDGGDDNKEEGNLRDMYSDVQQGTDVKPILCGNCNEAFSSQATLILHKCKTVESRTCEFCSKVYTKKSNFLIHTRTHTGEKPYHCPMCPRSFTKNSDLKRHVRTHTGQSPYQCLICSKGFTNLSDLHVHKRTHIGVKPFQCFICTRPFSNKIDLVRHIKTHTAERRHQCEICLKRFNSSYALLVHVRTHTGEKPFQCQICFERFTTNSDLLRHGKTCVCALCYLS